MSTYENEPIARNGSAIRLDYLGCLRPQQISQPTIYGTGIKGLYFRLINSRVWSVNGHLNKALSKGPLTTTWIWNLHSDAHDFDLQQSSVILITRKVFSSNVAHLSLVFFWISGMHLNGAYFSNYGIWLKDPKHSLPSAHNVWYLR